MNKKGYTLVELIITLAVIGIMVVPIFNTFTQSNRINIISKREVAGAYVAQNVMEELKAMSATDLTNRVSADPNDSIRLFTRDSANTTFTIRVEVTDVTSSLGLSLDAAPDPDAAPKVPDADITVTLPSAGNNGLIDFTDAFATDIAFSDISTNLLFRLSDDGSSYSFEYSMFDETFNILTPGNIQLNIVGPSSGLLLDWDIDLINISSSMLTATILDYVIIDVDTGEYEQPDNIDVRVSELESSTSDIYISAPSHPVVGSLQDAKSWFNVVVRVEHDGIEYEVLESTIGK
jgi:prepilin-type N-terminal cleavage/methylation domain-containing protein